MLNPNDSQPTKVAENVHGAAKPVSKRGAAEIVEITVQGAEPGNEQGAATTPQNFQSAATSGSQPGNTSFIPPRVSKRAANDGPVGSTSTGRGRGAKRGRGASRSTTNEAPGGSTSTGRGSGTTTSTTGFMPYFTASGNY